MSQRPILDLLALLCLISSLATRALAQEPLPLPGTPEKPAGAPSLPEIPRADSPWVDHPDHQVLGLPEWLISTDPVPELAPLPSDWDLFPRGTPFSPLLADPREPRTELALLRMHLPGEVRNVGFAFLGDTFGAIEYKWADRGEGDRDSVQLAAQGFVTPQVGFSGDLRGKLINVDFILGPVLSVRQGPLSARLRLYHQSSHLGDEFMQARPAVGRVNLSYESAELLGAYAYGHCRAYGGGAYKVRIDPNSIRRGELHLGAECRTPWRFLVIGRFGAAYDLRMCELQDWSPSHSTELALEMGQGDPTRRKFKVLAQYYNGYNPFGQFSLETSRISYYGLGLRFSY